MIYLKKINDDIKKEINKFGALCIGILPQDLKYKKSGFHYNKSNENDINNLKEIV